MDEPLRVHSPKELKFLLEVTPCARCGRGLMVGRLTDKLAPDSQGIVTLRARCSNCHAQRTFHIQFVKVSDNQPSEVVDLAQWVGLYHLYADEMDKADSPTDTRRTARLAAQCLAEALKFYAQEEMPPESAFRKAESVAAFRNNPANFARTHLRGLEAMLPAVGRTAFDGDETDRDSDKEPGKGSDNETAASKAWWKIW